MALARVTVWIPGDVLTAAALNGEFNNLINNPITLISPTTGVITFTTAQTFPASQVTSTSPRIIQVVGATTTGSNVSSTTPANVSGQPITPASTLSRIKLMYSVDAIQFQSPGIAQELLIHIATSSGKLVNSERVLNQINAVNEGVRAGVAWTYLVPPSTGPFPTNYNIQGFSGSSTGSAPFGEIRNVEMILEELSS